jgi:4-amino-4-deoxy-L-arabinose transferase-like glycosyltransferase
MEPQSRLGRLLFLGAVLLTAWLSMAAIVPDPRAALAAWPALIAATVAFTLLSLSHRSGAAAWLTAALDRLTPTIPLFVGAGFCAVVAWWLAGVLEPQPWGALAAWGGSVALFLVGCWRFHQSHPAQLADPQPPFARWEPAALAGITILAFVLRSWALADLPANFSGDEGEMGSIAREVIDGHWTAPFGTAWIAHPALWFYLQALGLTLFGDTVFGLRFVSTIVGTLAIPLLYVIARGLYGRPVALLSAGLLAIYHYHIHYSRICLNNIADPLLGIACLGALVYGFKRSMPAAFAVAGLACGIAQHGYFGSRLLPVLLVALLLSMLLIDRERLRAAWRGLALLPFGFLIGIGPLLQHFIRNPEEFSSRTNTVGVLQSGWIERELEAGRSLLQIIADQIYLGFGAYTFVPDTNTFYAPEMPLLDRTSAVLFIFGIGLAISRWRRIEYLLPLLWVVAAALFGGALLINPADSARYVTTAAAICILIALALEQLGALLMWALPQARRALPALGLAVVAALGAWNVNFYFREYAATRTFSGGGGETTTAIARYLRAQPDPIYVYMLTPPIFFFEHGAIRFIAADVPGVDVHNAVVTADALPEAPPQMRPIFILREERAPEIDAIRRRFPDGAVRRFTSSVDGSTLFVAYEPPAAAAVSPAP